MRYPVLGIGLIFFTDWDVAHGTGVPRCAYLLYRCIGEDRARSTRRVRQPSMSDTSCCFGLLPEVSSATRWGRRCTSRRTMGTIRCDRDIASTHDEQQSREY